MPDALAAAAQALRWSGEAHRGEGIGRRIQRQARAALAAALRPSASMNWFDSVDGPALKPFAQANPLLPLKPFRVYLSANWGSDRRRKVIQDTYATATRMGGALQRALLDREGVRFLVGCGEGESAIHLRLHREYRFRKEGEFTLSLECPALGGRVMSMAFSIERMSGGIAVYIGCLQGRDDGAEAIRSLTKALHGLRPKAFLMIAMQEVASALRAGELYGAGTAIQVHRRKHAVHLPWIHGLGFDYDAFWTDAGGTLDAGGWFRLPRTTPRRTRDEMKPNKRSMYAKRYELLDQLHAMIHEAF
ncbi:MAG: DUF535 family protein [Acidobacteria bacterium]|nr:DUF535 family protein [Acidobacteriota bacterium]